MVDAIIGKYDKTRNISDVVRLRQLLEEALTEDCELVEPRGRFVGREAIVERISGFHSRFPGARVDITTNVDEHNGFGRYEWRIVDGAGSSLLNGTDVVERTADGRLRRIVMFFGQLEPL